MSNLEKRKEVFFNIYCQTCKHKEEPSSSDACNECLNEPGRVDSHKPLNYEEED